MKSHAQLSQVRDAILGLEIQFSLRKAFTALTGILLPFDADQGPRSLASTLRPLRDK